MFGLRNDRFTVKGYLPGALCQLSQTLSDTTFDGVVNGAQLVGHHGTRGGGLMHHGTALGALYRQVKRQGQPVHIISFDIAHAGTQSIALHIFKTDSDIGVEIEFRQPLI